MGLDLVLNLEEQGGKMCTVCVRRKVRQRCESCLLSAVKLNFIRGRDSSALRKGKRGKIK
jgi:hypothetical protein